MTTTQTQPQPQTPAETTQAAAEQLAEQLAERLLSDAVTTMETFSVQLGVELGLYEALATGAADARELAQRAHIHPRYAREWLEQQAVAGILDATTSQSGEGHDDGDGETDPYARPFTLPSGHREALLNKDSPYFMGKLPGFIMSFGNILEKIADAFRTGGGVPYEAYGDLTRHGIAGLNGPMFRNELASWIAAMPDLERRLTVQPSRVLDLGCGTGSSSLALAEAFAQAQVRGIDLDEASVAEATTKARQSGLDQRVSFERADASTMQGTEAYQLVCIFEALHDMADPVGTLRAARKLLDPAGAVLVGDERVAEHFSAPGDLLERLNYGFSVLHCLPATRAEGSAVEAGTVLRPPTVRDYAAKAGYTCSVLPIDNDLWRFYRLDPA